MIPKPSVTWYIIAALTCYIVVLKSCQKACPPATVTVKRDTVYVKVEDKTEHYVPKIVSIKHDTGYLAMWVDTAMIVQAYKNKVAYQDTVRNKYGYVLIVDTIHENQIWDRQVAFHLDVPQTTLTNSVPPKNKMFIGPSLGGSKSFVSFGANLFLLTKSDNIYHAGVAYTSQGTLYYSAGAAFKIHF